MVEVESAAAVVGGETVVAQPGCLTARQRQAVDAHIARVGNGDDPPAAQGVDRRPRCRVGIAAAEIGRPAAFQRHIPRDAEPLVAGARGDAHRLSLRRGVDGLLQVRVGAPADDLGAAAHLVGPEVGSLAVGTCIALEIIRDRRGDARVDGRRGAAQVEIVPCGIDEVRLGVEVDRPQGQRAAAVVIGEVGPRAASPQCPFHRRRRVAFHVKPHRVADEDGVADRRRRLL